jgi:hypothetical protein
MIGQVGAHSRQIHPHRDLDRAQMTGRPDAGAHQDRGTAEDPRAEDNPARLDDIAVEQPDLPGTVSLEADLCDMHVGTDRQVRGCGAHREIGIRGGHAPAIP